MFNRTESKFVFDGAECEFIFNGTESKFQFDGTKCEFVFNRTESKLQFNQLQQINNEFQFTGQR